MSKILLDAARGIKTARPPLWMMRQAGRYLPEYMEIRGRMDTLTMFRTPRVAEEITLQPLRRFPLDAAIIYADILLIPDALGQGLSFVAGEGPVFARTIRARSDVSGLRATWEDEAPQVMGRLAHLGETLERVKPRLGPSQTLIGFAGAPWTVACYMIEGKGTQGEFFEARKLAWQDPDLLAELMDLVADVTISYLQMQISAGAEVLQLFESWGLSLSHPTFRKLCLPAVKKVIQAMPASVPIVYFVNGVSALLGDAVQSGAEVLGLDWRVDLEDTIARLQAAGVHHRQLNSAQTASRGNGTGICALQGNLDPIVLYADRDGIVQETERILNVARASPYAHIFNLGHGLRPTTPLQAVGWVAERVISSNTCR
jgi:uroporphyrinogen decarboxylase